MGIAKSVAIQASAEVGRDPFVQTIRTDRQTLSAKAAMTVHRKMPASRSIPSRSARV